MTPDVPPTAKRPNFIVVMTDQQRADHLGCYGNTVVKTPNLDALAARGKARALSRARKAARRAATASPAPQRRVRFDI